MSETETNLPGWLTYQFREGELVVSQTLDFCGVTLWLGNEQDPVTVGDGAHESFGDGDWLKPITRSVVIARLRAIADLIERNAPTNKAGVR